jgi:hypothetical protein
MPANLPEFLMYACFMSALYHGALAFMFWRFDR